MANTKIRANQLAAATATVGIVDAHIKADAGIAQSKISGLTSALTTLQDNIDNEETARINAVTDLNNAIIGIGTSTEWQASCNDYGITPPGSPAAGLRILVVESIDAVTGIVVVGTPTGAFAGMGGKIAVYANAAWTFTTPAAGTFTLVDTVLNGVLCFITSWSLKQFEGTTNGDGITKVGLALSANLHTNGGLLIDEVSKGIKIDDTQFVAIAAIRVRDPFTGIVDGSNAVFTLTATPVTGSEMVFINGMLQTPGNDYAIVGAVITMVGAPAATDTLVINYIAA